MGEMGGARKAPGRALDRPGGPLRALGMLSNAEHHTGDLCVAAGFTNQQGGGFQVGFRICRQEAF